MLHGSLRQTDRREATTLDYESLFCGAPARVELGFRHAYVLEVSWEPSGVREVVWYIGYMGHSRTSTDSRPPRAAPWLCACTSSRCCSCERKRFPRRGSSQ